MTGDAEFWPDDDEDTSCYFCDAEPATFASQVDDLELVVGTYSFTVGVLLLCSECMILVEAGDAAALVERQTTRGADERTRSLTPAIVNGALGQATRELAHHVVPDEIAELLRQGYDALDHHTGATDDLGSVWPAEHRATYPETRSWAEPGDVRWYVRSPWPSVALADIFMFIWPIVEHDRTHDQDVMRRRMHEALRWPEARARAAADVARGRS